MSNRPKRRGIIGSHDDAPRPAPLPQEAGAGGHADHVETRPAEPYPPRRYYNARRPPRPLRKIPFAYGRKRYGDADSPRHVAG
jgi:hypothetical protein